MSFHGINPFSSTAVPIRGQTALIPSDLSPKRAWGSKRVKYGPPYSISSAPRLWGSTLFITINTTTTAV